MDDLALLVDLHRDGERQGPGGDAETTLSVALSGLRGAAGLKIADIGCGTGSSTIALARTLDAEITAVDFLPEFLAVLDERAASAGVADRITTLAASMDALDFAPGSLDAIWSEEAIYNIGFENGARAWRRFLKPGGILAVSELTWLTRARPAALEAHWAREYAEVATASEKIAVLESHGYKLLGYFPLNAACWLENYYRPLQARFDAFLTRHDSDAAREIVKAEQKEILLYEYNSPYVSYGYYIAQKLPG